MPRFPSRVLLLFCLAPLVRVWGQPASAKARLLEGDGIVECGAGASWAKAVIGGDCSPGLRTGPWARARLELPGGIAALGAGTETALSADGKSLRLKAGFLIMERAAAGLSVVTTAGTAGVEGQGARFLVEVSGAKVRVRSFSGGVSFKRKGAAPVAIAEGRSLEAGPGGIAPLAGAAAGSIAGSGWLIEPPRGYTAEKDDDGLVGWSRSWEEKVPVGEGAAVSVRRRETVVFAFEDVDWTKGQPWPQDCRRANAVGNALLFGEVRSDSAAGLPAFFYTCVVPGGLKYMDRSSAPPVWRVSSGERHRYRDVAVDFDGRGSAHALWMRYSHTAEAAEIPGLDAEKMDEIRKRVGMEAGGDKDGPGANAYFESLETLRAPPSQPAAPQKPKPAGGAVPLLR